MRRGTKSSQTKGWEEIYYVCSVVSFRFVPASFFMWLYPTLVSAISDPLLSVILENMCKVSRLVGFGGNTGTATTPAFKHAINATVKSNDGGYTSKALHFFFWTTNEMKGMRKWLFAFRYLSKFSRFFVPISALQSCLQKSLCQFGSLLIKGCVGVRLVYPPSFQPRSDEGEYRLFGLIWRMMLQPTQECICHVLLRFWCFTSLFTVDSMRILTLMDDDGVVAITFLGGVFVFAFFHFFVTITTNPRHPLQNRSFFIHFFGFQSSVSWWNHIDFSSKIRHLWIEIDISNLNKN